jgi:hypothetical protein
LKKPITKKDWWSGSRCRPLSKPQYCKQIKKYHHQQKPPTMLMVSNLQSKGINLTICCLPETYLTDKGKYWLRVKVLKKIFQENGLPKQAKVAILISDKADFKPKLEETKKVISY